MLTNFILIFLGIGLLLCSYFLIIMVFWHRFWTLCKMLHNNPFYEMRESLILR
jgi:hypothetical protein